MTPEELTEIEKMVRRVAADLYWQITDTLGTPAYAMGRLDAYLAHRLTLHKCILTDDGRLDAAKENTNGHAD